MHRHLLTTNALESFLSNVRQRTNQIDVFTTEDSFLTIGCRDDPGYPLAPASP
jgi:putative transposase